MKSPSEEIYITPISRQPVRLCKSMPPEPSDGWIKNMTGCSEKKLAQRISKEKEQSIIDVESKSD